MSSRTGFPAFSLDRGTVTVYGSFVSGGASITSQDCAGFVLTQTGTGAYTVTFGNTGAVDKYPFSPANYVAAGTTTNPILCASMIQVDSTNSQALTMVIKDATLIQSAGTLTFVLNSAANTPANPTSGSTILLCFEMKNTTTPRKGS